MKTAYWSVKNLVIVVACIFILVTVSANAQQKSEAQRAFVGFKTSFGSHFLNLRSNHSELNGMKAQFDGGSIGVVAGNQYMQMTSTIAGFFYSADHVARTVDLVSSDVTVKLFPLSIAQVGSRLQPYIFSGVGLSRLKFYGHYLYNDPVRPVNYSAPEPYLGKQRTISALGGVGLDYNFPQYDFLHLFLECSVSKSIHRSADHAFRNTDFSLAHAVQVGVLFGSRK